MAGPAQAQPKTDGLPYGGWHIATARITLNAKWSAVLEAQTRSARFAGRYFYHEFKGGAGYDLGNKTQAFVGLGNYTTYDPDSPENFGGNRLNEWRIWEQFTLNNHIKRLKIDHRFRIEQRFFNDNRYRNRFRYRINATLPINHKGLMKNTLFVNSYNEIFLNNQAPHFERNRLYVGGGYEFSKNITLMAGIINQYDYTLGSRLSRNFIQTSLLFSFSRKGGSREMTPNTMD